MKTLLIFLFIFLYVNICWAQPPRLVPPLGHTAKADVIHFLQQDKYILSLSNQDGAAFLWDKRTGQLLSNLGDSSTGFFEGNKERYFAITKSTKIPGIHIYSKKSADLIRTVSLENFPPDIFLRCRFTFSESEDSIIIVQLGTNNRIVIDSKSGKISENQFDKKFEDYFEFISFNTKDTFYSEGKQPLMAIPGDNGSIRINSSISNKQVAVLEKKSAIPACVAFSKDDALVAIGTDNGTTFIMNLEKGKMEQIFKGDNHGITSCDISLTNRQVVTCSANGLISIGDMVTGKWIKKINNLSKLATIRFDHTGKYLLGITSQYDTLTRQLIHTALLWDIKTGYLVKTIMDYQEQLQVLTLDNGTIDKNGERELHLIYNAPPGNINYDSSNKHYCFSLKADSLLLFFKSLCLNYDGTYASDLKLMNPPDVLTQSEKEEMVRLIHQEFGPQVDRLIQNNKIYSLDYSMEETPNHAGVISNRSRYILQYGNTGVSFFNAASNQLLFKLYLFNSSGYLIQLPSDYYMSSPGAAMLLHYVKDLKMISFDQLDVKYNRPDKVLEATGSNDTALIKSYRKAWEKRIKKLGIDTTAFRANYSIPEADFIKRDQIEYEQNNEKLVLLIKGTDSLYKLDRFNVWVNEVPVYGQRGIGIRKRNLTYFDTTITIQLSLGENRIETSITNINGAESYRMPLLVNYSPDQPAKEMAYFIGIGIDQFADNKYDLQYSSKDIRNLSMDLSAKYRNSIVIDTLFNKGVSVKNIKAIKKKLLKTSVNDKLIIAYSGHGLLSKDFDYYLSTYTVDFSNPGKNGLPYDELENLLDSIPARKKLMLIDACHSGEVDKEEGIAMNKTADSMGLTKGVLFPQSPQQQHMGLHNSFELMQSLFVNVGKSTGATIISAAAGNQFALERGDLKNGVFTFAILEAMKSHPTIKISELKNTVGERVEQLTNGMQKPTSRNETIAVDWSVW